MSKFTNQLGAIGIHNLYDMTSKGLPMIHYTVPGSQSVLNSRWLLSIKGKHFKDAAWYDHGSLSFVVYGGVEKRNEGLFKALDSCKELFPDVEMVKSPWPFSYVNKVDLDRVKALIEKKY